MHNLYLLLLEEVGGEEGDDEEGEENEERKGREELFLSCLGSCVAVLAPDVPHLVPPYAHDSQGLLLHLVELR